MEKNIILFGSMILFYLLFKILLNKRKYYLFFIVALPGTFFHELSHYVISYITFGKPTKFSIFPKKDGNIWILGYVESANLSWWNQSFVALAPLLLIPFSIPVIQDAMKQEEYIYIILYGYILANFIEGAIPSKTDIVLALKKPIPIVFILFFLMYQISIMSKNDIYNHIDHILMILS